MSINHYSMKAFLHFLYTTARNFNGQSSILRKFLLFGRNFVCITLLILPQIMNPLTLISIQRKSWDNTIIISGRGRSPNVSNCSGIDITCGGFSDGASGKEPDWQCRRYKRSGFDPWVRKIPWRKAWQPTPVFLTAESHWPGAWWATIHRVTELDTTEVT